MKKLFIVLSLVAFQFAEAGEPARKVNMPTKTQPAADLQVKRDAEGNLVFEERDFVSFLERDTREKQAATREMLEAVALVRSAEIKLKNVTEILRKEAEEEEAQIAELTAVLAEQEKTLVDLKEARAEVANARVERDAAMASVNAAYAEINRRKKTAWVPFPINVVAKILGAD